MQVPARRVRRRVGALTMRARQGTSRQRMSAFGLGALVSNITELFRSLLRSLRLRVCRSSSVADASLKRSTAWPAISLALAARLGRALACRPLGACSVEDDRLAFVADNIGGGVRVLLVCGASHRASPAAPCRTCHTRRGGSVPACPMLPLPALGERRHRRLVRRLVSVRRASDIAIMARGPHPGAILWCGRR
jgi:hypothetical protein